MNLASKSAMALAGASGVAGGGVLLSKNLKGSSERRTISQHIQKEYLLTTDTKDSDKWNQRIALLKKSDESKLIDSLLALKKKDTTLTTKDLQDWCAESLKGEFKGSDDSKFQNVRLYCGLNIGDKITGTKVNSSLQNSDPKLKTNVDKLAGKKQEELGEKLFAVIGKANTQEPWAGNEALKNWCVETLELAFEEGSNYSNAQLYCVTT
ncbi:hypothetical protein HF1_09430 [Mycoplasma haemofelis str. Langford 1]|uniref:Uncharacterized protein n=1 Tax=Mycoplasma haemofelis (strain Langford 1) TaxID=941640 RepID=E8ZII0_MYCHL|nr:hypothetical protein [Mycoplasma haemofelis]CBY92951.1 hypothetical protein HF1_09430 [Mycoplasma haemofelis str. Langford 1]